MSRRIILASLLILVGFFIGYHAIGTLSGWQYRNQEAFGVASLAPYVEMALALALALVGLWLLFKRQ